MESALHADILYSVALNDYILVGHYVHILHIYVMRYRVNSLVLLRKNNIYFIFQRCSVEASER
jgi:hypothetical protein